jgi:glycosyltransferase involved in cell wall biosynthesis
MGTEEKPIISMNGYDSVPSGDLLLSIVIPVYNEKATLPRVIRSAALALPDVPKEILVIDDGSTDGTREWLRESFPNDVFDVAALRKSADGSIGFLGVADGDMLVGDDVVCARAPTTVRIHFHKVNGGKGRALRTGFECAKGDIIVIQDADLEYDPSDWLPMMRLMALGVADVVYGSRFYGRPHRSLYLYHLLGNKAITFLFNILFDQTLTDLETCYKMFHRKTIEGVRLTSNDFAIEVELSAVLAGSKKWRVYETGITYYGRTYEEGKKINWRDGILALWYVIKFRFL